MRNLAHHERPHFVVPLHHLKVLEEISILADQRVHLVTSKRSHLQNDLEVHLSLQVVDNLQLNNDAERIFSGLSLLRVLVLASDTKCGLPPLPLLSLGFLDLRVDLRLVDDPLNVVVEGEKLLLDLFIDEIRLARV